MLSRVIVVSCLLLQLAIFSSARAVEIKGKVTEAKDNTVKITTDSDQMPNIGDTVQIYFEVPGLSESIDVGAGKVTEVTSDFITATIQDAKTKLTKDQLARITSDRPRKRSEVGTSAANADADGPPGEIRQFKGHTGIIWNVAFSPDGRRAISGSTDDTVRVWNVDTGKEIRKMDAYRCYCAAFSPDGRRIAYGVNQSVIVRDLESGQQLAVFEDDGELSIIFSVEFSHDGERLLTGSRNGPARLWDIASGREIRKFQTSDANSSPDGGRESLAVRRAIFSPDKRLVLGACYSCIAIWELETGRELRTIVGDQANHKHVAISADSRYVTTGSDYAGPIQMWDVASGQEVHRFLGFRGGAEAVAFLPNGRRILAGGFGSPTSDNPDRDYSLRLWDVDTGRELHRFEGHREAVRCLAVSPDGKRALSAGEDHTVRLWRLPK